MKISIITATYNSAATVKDTLQSIASQTYDDIEHIVVDGISNDDTISIVKSFSHIAKFSSEKDKGIYDAMNKGIALATGDVIGILNSDDLYMGNDVIEKIMKVFSEPGVEAVYGDLLYVQQNNIEKTVRTWRAGNFKKNKFYYGWMPPHPSFFVRRDVYERFGNFNLQLRTAADYEIMLRFLFKNDLVVRYIPEFLVRMRTGGASNATLMRRIRANRQDKLAWQLNGLQPKFFTLALKPLRKINQFLIK